MKNHHWGIITLFLILPVMIWSVAGMTIETAGAAEKTYRLKIQSLYPHGDLSMEKLKVFARVADERSNGQLKIRVFAEPEIIPGDQLFGGTRQGVVDMLQGMGGMWGGMVPVGYVEFNLPMAFRIDEETTWEDKARAIREFYFEKGFADLLRKAYAKHGLYFLDIHTYGPVPFVLSTKPATSCSDFQGWKIKADGGNLAFHSAVGMQGASISPTETYMALKLGTVDAAEWDVSAVTGLKWHEVAPYWIRGMECDHTMGHILVNLKKWNKLPDHLKTVLHEAAEAYWHATVAGYKEEMKAVETLVKAGELKEMVLDDACQESYRNAAYKIWEELAAQDDTSAQAIEMIKQWRGVE